MDSSIRLYPTNSAIHPVLDAERKGLSTISLRDEHEDGQTAGFVKETAGGAAPVLSSAQQVDVADFEAIFLRFQNPITNYIYHLLGNREQAYDLAQDVFVKAYKALLGGTVVQQGALSAWLYRIASNTATDALRRRRLITWLPLSLFNEDRGIGAGVLSEAGGNAAENFTNNEEESGHNNRGSSVSAVHERGGYDGGRFESRVADREIVERVFQQLPEKYAVCLWLYENDGLSCAEIAEILHISSSAVKMRLMRARERFIHLYKQEVSNE